jgi:hypothetical protein
MRNGIFRKRDGSGIVARWNGAHWDLPLDLWIPDDEQIRAWIMGDELCESPTGHTVEPDGTGPDGCPSWLLLLGLM